MTATSYLIDGSWNEVSRGRRTTDAGAIATERSVQETCRLTIGALDMQLRQMSAIVTASERGHPGEAHAATKRLWLSAADLLAATDAAV